MFLLGTFVFGLKVLIWHVRIRPKSSYWARPLIKVKELRFQGHALHIDKKFLSRDEIMP